MATQVYSASTPEEFKRLSVKNGGVELLAHLTKYELSSSASRWGLRHLLGFRLLTLPERPFLDVLQSKHNDCPLCCPEGPGSHQIDHYWAKILTSTCELDVGKSAHSELLRLQGGFFWVALARASCTEAISESKEYPQRHRRPRERDGYIDSAAAIVGSSSPAHPSSSEFEADFDDVDEDEHDARRGIPEEITAHLLSLSYNSP
ncbi:hypothetical protein AnigIFM63604_002729 [Aspergillus niger]|uniref:Uncharacterized protein n=1 Tax=Aspergillus niger TaxID=5061 RepID=A0A9W6EG50_ASPNG|nr:hypothetical protein AnigIFM63604_002729 [Aspergillus niger]